MTPTGVRLRRLVPDAWAVVLAVVVLGPALGVGYVLSYDMVWVPDLAVRRDFLGLGTALPRAVPSDLVVALLDEVVPGMLLQKIVLLGALVAGGLGAARLAGRGTAARLVAVSVAIWSPYVVERLWIGHWPVLLCWATLPWVVLQAVRFRADPHVGVALPLLLVAGSLSANAGLMTGATLLAVGFTRRLRPTATLVALVAAANAPWIGAGLLHASAATGTETGLFALQGDALPAPLAALSLGGIWNAQVVPGSRDVLLVEVVTTVLLLAAAAYGVRPAWRRLGSRTAWSLAGLWLTGYLIAVLSWAAPGATAWVGAHVPGGGLLRDGARWLALCVPLVVVVVAAGCERLVRRVSLAPLRRVALVGMALAPLALLPGAAWGGLGELRAVRYPAEWAAARASLDERPAGDLLVLPFSSFRAPAWNHDHTVLDPLPRFLQPDYVVNDELAVDRVVIPGEDPRTPQVYAALAEPTPAARSQALADLGISLVARERDVAGLSTQDAALRGTALHQGPELEVVRLDAEVAVRDTPARRWVAMGGSWAAWSAVVLVAAWNAFQIVISGMRRRPRDQ